MVLLIFNKCTQVLTKHNKYLQNKTLSCISDFFLPAAGPVPGLYYTDYLDENWILLRRKMRDRYGTKSQGAIRKGWNPQILKWHASLNIKSSSCSRNNLQAPLNSWVFFRFLVSLVEILISGNMLKKEVAEEGTETRQPVIWENTVNWKTDIRNSWCLKFKKK